MWNEKTSRFLVSQKGAFCENQWLLAMGYLAEIIFRLCAGIA